MTWEMVGKDVIGRGHKDPLARESRFSILERKNETEKEKGRRGELDFSLGLLPLGTVERERFLERTRGGYRKES